MKQVTCFQCEICDEVYADKDEATSCEKTHRADSDLKIIDTKHRFDFSRYGYPEKILIEIDGYSGCLAEYELRREGSCEEFDSYRKAIDDADY